MDFDDFTNQTLAADPYHVKHIGVPHALRDDQRTGYFFNYAFAHFINLR